MAAAQLWGKQMATTESFKAVASQSTPIPEDVLRNVATRSKGLTALKVALRLGSRRPAQKLSLPTEPVGPLAALPPLPLTKTCNLGHDREDGKKDPIRKALSSVSTFDGSNSSNSSAESSSDSPSPPMTPTARSTQVKKATQSLLNKVCPENLWTIAQQLKELPLEGASDLEALACSIVNKAVREPHYGECYADLVCNIEADLIEFPDMMDNSRTINLKTVLLTECQLRFEAFPASMDAFNYDEELAVARRQSMRATCRFLGHLFVRQVLPSKVLKMILEQFIPKKDVVIPEEHIIESTCELLMVVGGTMEKSHKSLRALDGIVKRLSLIQQQGCSKRIQFAIQDVLDSRAAKWQCRGTKDSAKTKDEIRRDQAKGSRPVRQRSGSAN